MSEICGAKTRNNGEPCQRKAGWGTDHLGEGKCKNHGGATPVKHGFYSKYSSRKLSNRIEDIRDTEQLVGDLEDEITTARAIISTQLDKAETLNTEDSQAILNLLEATSRMIKRHNKIQHGEKIVHDFEGVDQFINVIQTTIINQYDRTDTAEELIEKIELKLTEGKK